MGSILVGLTSAVLGAAVFDGFLGGMLIGFGLVVTAAGTLTLGIGSGLLVSAKRPGATAAGTGDDPRGAATAGDGASDAPRVAAQTSTPPADGWWLPSRDGDRGAADRGAADRGPADHGHADR